jgi:hypothetical protein
VACASRISCEQFATPDFDEDCQIAERGYPTQDDFWPKFWKLYAKTKSPDAGNITRPPIR